MFPLNRAETERRRLYVEHPSHALIFHRGRVTNVRNNTKQLRVIEFAERTSKQEISSPGRAPTMWRRVNQAGRNNRTERFETGRFTVSPSKTSLFPA